MKENTPLWSKKEETEFRKEMITLQATAKILEPYMQAQASITQKIQFLQIGKPQDGFGDPMDESEVEKFKAKLVRQIKGLPELWIKVCNDMNDQYDTAPAKK